MNIYVIPAQVEVVCQKIHFLQPQSTLDPSSVSLPAKGPTYFTYYERHIPLAISFSVLLFCIFHHAHIMEKHACHSMLSKFALVFGVVAAMGAFAAANCNVSFLLNVFTEH